MKHLDRSFGVLLILSILGCSSLKTSYDYDREADFSLLKTYKFADAASELPLNDLNKARLTKAVSTELEAKGFSVSDNPDVIIDLLLTAQQKQSATATTTGTGMGGYGRRGGWGYGGGMTTTQVNYNEYTVGTLFVSMVEASKQQLIWQGRVEKTVSEGASAEKREKNINSAVAKIFDKYPPK